MEVFNLKECLIFLEDIPVYSELITGHLIRMEAAFSRLKENCFKLKLQYLKCLRPARNIQVMLSVTKE